MSSSPHVAASPVPMSGVAAAFEQTLEDEYVGLATICFVIILYFISFTLFFKTRSRNNESDSDDATVRERPVFREREIVQIEAMVFIYREAKGSENNDDNECVICLNKFEDGQKCRLMKKCGHIFHCSCIDRWLKTERECPLCRSCVCVVVVKP